MLARGGYSAADAVITVLLLAPPAILLFFAQGLAELIALPERLKRMPGEGGQRLEELTRIAGEVRTTRLQRRPVAALAPARLARLAPRPRRRRAAAARARAGFLGLTAVAALLCIVLTCAGVIALVVLAIA